MSFPGHSFKIDRSSKIKREANVCSDRKLNKIHHRPNLVQTIILFNELIIYLILYFIENEYKLNLNNE